MKSACKTNRCNAKFDNIFPIRAGGKQSNNKNGNERETETSNQSNQQRKHIQTKKKKKNEQCRSEG